MKPETRIWYGWRVGAVEEWELDGGVDGSWTPSVPSLGVDAVDTWGDHEATVARIRRALDKAGHPDGVVLTRASITVYGETREVARG